MMVRTDKVFMGVRIWFDAKVTHLAQSQGIWRKRIVIGPTFLRLTTRQSHAVLLHEMGHIRGRHMLRRLMILPIFWTNYASRVARQHEFEADAFCASEGYGLDLMQVIRRLCSYQSDPFYPSVDERCARLARLSRERDHVRLVA